MILCHVVISHVILFVRSVRRQGDPLDPEFGVILKGSVSVRAHHKDISDHVANPVLKRRLLLLREEAKR